jgi:uncharacterized protein YkwD
MSNLSSAGVPPHRASITRVLKIHRGTRARQVLAPRASFTGARVQVRQITGIASIFMLLALGPSGCHTGHCPDGREWSIPAEEPEAMVALINGARTEVGLAALTRNGMLSLVASEHSKDMACRDFFDHINPDGQNPADRVQEAGAGFAPPYRWIAENIGTRATAREQFDSWMASEDHRTNILDERVDEMGVGLIHIGEGSRYTDYWTVVFLGRNR